MNSIELIFNDPDRREFKDIVRHLDGKWLVVTSRTGNNYEGWAETVNDGIQLTDDNSKSVTIEWGRIQTVNL